MLAPQSLILQLGYALLIAAVLAPRLHQVRLLIALAALAGLGRALWTGDMVSVAWMSALAATAMILAGRRLWEDGNARFTADERAMIEGLFGELPSSRARHLIDQGLWLTGKQDDVLTREGEPVDHLYYLAQGEARVISTGRQVGTCRPGDLIGELTVLSGETASATVILNGPARFWCAPATTSGPMSRRMRTSAGRSNMALRPCSRRSCAPATGPSRRPAGPPRLDRPCDS